jgi:7-carboxy-7-deazaguanine synthase
MRLCEIYTSIQGESTCAGLVCTFIRLAGCNLRCSYCDTEYAYDEGTEISVDELLGKALNRRVDLVEVTGGEPLLQEETPILVKRILDEGYRVLIETNGSFPIGGIDRRATVIMDVKTPASGMSNMMNLENLRMLKPTDEVKFVVADRADYEWARDFTQEYSLVKRCRVLMSAVFGKLSPENLSTWIIEDCLGVRLNLQLHKYVFGPDRRAV